MVYLWRDYFGVCGYGLVCVFDVEEGEGKEGGDEVVEGGD